MILTIFFFLSLALNLCFSETQSTTTTTTYVIHMDKSKMEALEVSIRSLGSSHTWYEELIESVRISSSSNDDQPYPILLYVYQYTIFGISARLTGQQLQTLQTMDGYLHATEGKRLDLHTTHSPQFLNLQQGQGLWSQENLASDVIIGVIDTGVWPEHSSFLDANLSPVPPRWKGKCKNYKGFPASSCNKKLIGAEVFYKGYEEDMIEDKTNDTSEYKSPRDSDGHGGTHTASTAGGNFVSNASIFGMANGTAAGMRPTARIAAYKVCFQHGCADSDILAAIDRAVHDGVDVLSISIGYPSPLPYFHDLLAIGAFHAVQKGVIVSLPAWNSGPDSYTVVNVAPWMMTVGASSTDRDFLAHVNLGDGTKFSGSSLSSHQPIKKASLVYNHIKGARLCLNGSLSRILVKGTVVICDRGGSDRVFKGEEVKRAGGVAMILANTPKDGEDSIVDPHVLPTVALGASAANTIKEYANSSKNPILSIQFRGTVYHNRAPLVASFSSRGPSALDPNILKPDITAPGVNILAAFPPNISPTNLKGDKRRVLFNMMSGTSMSCPHVSGLVALLKSLHGDWSPAAIKSALMTTAYVLDSENSPISDMIDGRSPVTPFALGSGHVDPNKASDPGLIYDMSTQDYLNYLCTLNYNSMQMKLFSGMDNTCPVGSRFSPGDLNYPSFSVVFDAKGRCNKFTTTNKRTVTNVGSSEVITYYVKVSEPEGVSITVNPSVLKFTKNRNKLSYNVTFKGKGMSMRPKTSNFYSGYIIWVSQDNKYIVRSPIAVIWKM